MCWSVGQVRFVARWRHYWERGWEEERGTQVAAQAFGGKAMATSQRMHGRGLGARDGEPRRAASGAVGGVGVECGGAGLGGVSG